jgi:hypothetical protein
MGCFTTLIFIAGFVFVMVSLLRWFEQITEAVDLGLWNKVITLIAVPWLVWFYPGRVAAGRPTPFPLHEPVRGFGTVPKTKPTREPHASEQSSDEPPLANVAPAPDEPPPGTPAEFRGMPKIPPQKPKGSRPGIDPEKLEKLRQKMREQGMLPPAPEE